MQSTFANLCSPHTILIPNAPTPAFPSSRIPTSKKEGREIVPWSNDVVGVICLNSLTVTSFVCPLQGYVAVSKMDLFYPGRINGVWYPGSLAEHTAVIGHLLPVCSSLTPLFIYQGNDSVFTQSVFGIAVGFGFTLIRVWTRIQIRQRCVRVTPPIVVVVEFFYSIDSRK